MAVFFDITTSARWRGHAVGIVRVERELARRAPSHIEGLGYCVYDRAKNNFVKLKADVAREILDGRLVIQFEGAAQPRVRGRLAEAKTRLRNQIIGSPRLYQIIQRLRGRSFSVDQIRHIRAKEIETLAHKKEAEISEISLDAAAECVVELNADVMILSGGLDWEYKDLRAIYKLKKLSGMKYAAILYDLIPELFPQFVVPSYVDLLLDYFGELFWVADCVMAISAQSKLDMERYCQERGMPTPTADHFALGADLPVQDRSQGNLPKALVGKRYALYVSTIEPRKNHRAVYEAWDYSLRNNMIDPEADRLVFVGRSGWNTGDLLHEINHNPVTKDTIVILSNVSDEDLQRIYREATFGLFPSHYEGYGLPLAEMLNLGKACISSRAGSLLEVGGDLVTYVEPFDRLGWAREMASFFSDKAKVEAIEARVAREYIQINWDRSAREFFTKLEALSN